MKSIIPVFKDIECAADRISVHIMETPILESSLLNEKVGGRVLLKPESLQRTGSFKFRGALNAILQLSEDDRKNGVVAYSSGNHAQGVAAAAQVLGLSAVIIMPTDAPAIKVSNTIRYGAEVIFYDRREESREEIGKEISIKRGATLIKPYDDHRVIAGQGTVGLEISKQSDEMGISIDDILVPCGGGGLVSGVALAISNVQPMTSIYSVEPDGFDDTARSLRKGERLSNNENNTSFCDALLAPEPGMITFPINKHLLKSGLVVTDQETEDAICKAFSYFKLILEPGGAVALAAVLSGKVSCQGKIICVVCSGGNVDPQQYLSILEKNLKNEL